jgi:hypothetical protein
MAYLSSSGLLHQYQAQVLCELRIVRGELPASTRRRFGPSSTAMQVEMLARGFTIKELEHVERKLRADIEQNKAGRANGGEHAARDGGQRGRAVRGCS